MVEPASREPQPLTDVLPPGGQSEGAPVPDVARQTPLQLWATGLAAVAAVAMLALWFMPVDWRGPGVEVALLVASVAASIAILVIEVRRESMPLER